jgi:glyoxylase-like metal-dependent hydrolase (beta-lactamase superfamily II)
MDSGASFIFAGDTVSLEDNLTYKIPGSNSWCAQQSTDSLYRLEHLSHLLSAQVIPSHDIQKWSKLKKCPDFYE